MSFECDAIVVGAGHNGLILGTYLARAGLEVVCLERRSSVGGGLTTIEYPEHSGFLHNTHSFFHRGVTQLPWYQDLELAKHGAQYIQPAVNVALVTRDGQALIWHEDFDKTLDSVSQFSRRDAEKLAHWRKKFRPIVSGILEPESQAPPLPAKQRREHLAQSNEGRQLLQLSEMTPWDFVTREFEHPTVQSALLFFNGLREVDLRQPGMAHHVPALMASDRMAQICVGGSAQLSTALVSAFQEAGGTVQTDVVLEQILVEGQRVVGIRESDGQEYRVKQLIASALNPQQTFLELLAAEYVPTDWRRQALEFRYNTLAPLFGIYVNLTSPPRYAAADMHASADEALMVIVGLDHSDQFPQIVQHHESGTIPPTVMWGSCPSRFDATQAPAGKHTAFMWEKLPYQLHGDSRHWDSEKLSHGRDMLCVWKEYVPQLDEKLLEWFVTSPLDTERALVNMRYGDLLVGSFSHGQTGYHRPFPGAGHYRSHLQGLYLCGSSCHPGGNVTGLPGYNSAQVVLADLGLDWHQGEAG